MNGGMLAVRVSSQAMYSGALTVSFLGTGNVLRWKMKKNKQALIFIQRCTIQAG